MKYKDVNDWLEKCKELYEYDFSEDTQLDNVIKEKDYGKIPNAYEKFFVYMTIANKWNAALSIDSYKEAGVMKYGIQYLQDCAGYRVTVHPDQNSKLLQEIYKRLWKDNTTLKMCGETMNTVNTTLGKLYEICIEPYDLPKKYREEIRPKNIKSQQISIAYIISRFAENKQDQEKKYNQVKGLREFLSIYHTLGNFIPIPEECNAPRGTCLLKDYWDLTLACIYNWYLSENRITKKVKGKYIEYSISMIFSKERHLIWYAEWLESFGKGQEGWNNFVEKNFMQPFVEENKEGDFGRPLPLWDGHFENEIKPTGKRNDEGVKDYEQFFSNASKWIEKRGKLMVEELEKD